MTKITKSHAGRPSTMTQDTLQKLEEAFSMGCSDMEACFYAGIAETTLYYYQQDNPDYLRKKELLKQNPLVKARNTIISNLHKADVAQWYLERRNRIEFGNKTETDVNVIVKPQPIMGGNSLDVPKDNSDKKDIQPK